MSSETTPLLSNQDDAPKKAHIVSCPPAHDARTLVLLFDGTGDTDDKDITNVIALRNMLHPLDDPEQQLVFYQPGIGTHDVYIPGTKVKLPLSGRVSRTLDAAIAWSLKKHVVEGYKWIMKNYREGDKICMFGFSRGAYTARAVAGMINKVGLLPITQEDQAESAFDSFELTGSDGWAHSKAFRDLSEYKSVTIEFIGVWDTVNSVGAIRAKKLPHTASNGSVRTFRHAVSLDERRARFRTNMWGLPRTDQTKQTVPLQVVTDVDQVWFSGAHCDVGGGSIRNGTRPNLAHIALRWMVRECFKTNTGLMFDPAQIMDIGIAPDSLYPIVKPRPAAIECTPDDRVSALPGIFRRASSWVASWFTEPTKLDVTGYSEERLDLVDALAPIFDQLVIKGGKWWVLEVAWLQKWSRRQKKYVHCQNLGRGRTIPKPVDGALTDTDVALAKGQLALHPRWAKVRVHRTVKTRMACLGDGKTPQYVPKALMDELTLDKVDPELIEWVD